MGLTDSAAQPSRRRRVEPWRHGLRGNQQGNFPPMRSSIVCSGSIRSRASACSTCPPAPDGRRGSLPDGAPPPSGPTSLPSCSMPPALGRQPKAWPLTTASQTRADAVRARRVRCRGLDLRSDVRQSSRGRGIRVARVVRPGGRVALATWSPDGNVFGMFKVMRAYMPAPAVPAPPTPFAWGRPERVRELLGDAFSLRFEQGTSFIVSPPAEAAWQTFSTDTDRRASCTRASTSIDGRRSVTTSSRSTPVSPTIPRRLRAGDYLVTVGTRR